MVRQESAKLLSSVRFWPDTFNPVDFHGINLIPSRQIGKVTSLWTSCLEVRPLPWEPARLMELVYILVLETRFYRFESCIGHWILYPNICRIGLMVRQEIPNLLMWVRFLHPVPNVLLAQWNRAVGYEPMCREFKSLKGRLTFLRKSYILLIEVKSLLYPYEVYHT